MRVGKIYELQSVEEEKIYIGSTKKKYLCNRKSEHKGHYKDYLNGKKGYCSSFELIKFVDCKIILLEEFEYKDISELRKRENKWIGWNKEICVNKQKAYATPEEKKKKRNKAQKKYADANKDKISENNKKQYRKNIKKRAEYAKKRAHEIIECECGRNYKGKQHRKRHEATKYHIDNI